jgi:adenylate cyclase
VSGERKQVSVLFADVVGSMLLAERLDAERLRVVMAELTRRCAQCVTRFEGMVDKFTGDGIMALFGAPIALEDHARRACYAGLEMQRAVAGYAGELREGDGIELALRVGINSGEVIVGDIATAERFTYTAIGHTVGLAQRMEALAAPGSVYLTARRPAGRSWSSLSRTRTGSTRPATSSSPTWSRRPPGRALSW